MLEQEIAKYKTLKREIDRKNKELKKVREMIIEQMRQENLKSVETEVGSAKLTIPHGFDEQQCSLDNEKEYSLFLTIKTVTQQIEEFDRKGFEKKFPELFSKYQVEQTPRLSIK